MILQAWHAQARACATWGRAAQAFMVAEEAGELVAAIAKFQRGRVTADDVLQEAADGLIVSVAAAYLAGKTAADLEQAVAAKLARLLRRLDGEPGHIEPAAGGESSTVREERSLTRGLPA